MNRRTTTVCRMEPRYTRVTVLKTVGLKHSEIARQLALRERSVDEYVGVAREEVEREVPFLAGLNEAVAWRLAGFRYLRRHSDEVREQLRNSRQPMNRTVLDYFEALFHDSVSGALLKYKSQRPSLDVLIQTGLYGEVLRSALELEAPLRAFRHEKEIWRPLYEVQGLLIMGLANDGQLEAAKTVAGERLELAKNLEDTDVALALRDKGSIAYASRDFEEACQALLAAKAILLEKDDIEWGQAKSRLSSEIACSLARVEPADPRIDDELTYMLERPSPEHVYTELEVSLLRDDLAKTREILSKPPEPILLDVSGQALVNVSEAILEWKLMNLDLTAAALARATVLAEQAHLEVIKPSLEAFSAALEQLRLTGRASDFDPAKEVVLFSMHRLQRLHSPKESTEAD